MSDLTETTNILLNAAELADLLGVHVSTIHGLKQRGAISYAKGTRYGLKETMRAIYGDLHAKAGGRDRNKSAEDAALTAARRRKVEAEADLAEQKAAQQRGELVEAAQVVAGWQSILVRLRADLLAVPDRLREDTSRDVADRVDRAIRDALETLADD
ncbi:hypothetical protein LWC05_03250 [Acetobacter sicerae]|uniref:Helix-turn-helix domain-containing protein n=1 Tax=Acetobacter sicerae TaxID=85325 RepID=A0ABS8VSF5_9PROT|nr:hypothetical protein [Acetobacter sicerae]MCE0742908.1 hypothetical protein [Acetobacter sicerae]